MAAQATRLPSSEVPDVGDGLWERIQAAVLAESGAGKSLWNGRLDYIDAKETNLGEAYGDGSLKLHREHVVRPLQEMYAKRGQRVTEAELIERRMAFEVVAHEFGHLAVPENYQIADRVADMGIAETTAIEEGTNEAWSQAKTDALIDRALPPDLALQLKAVDSPRLYPGWEPAARAFAEDIGAELNLDPDEVLSVMNREPRSGKARAAADLLFDKSELPRLVPPDQQAAVRLQLQGRIDQAFADLRPLNADTTVNRRSVAAQRGQAIAAGAVRTVRAAEKHFRAVQEAGRAAQNVQETSKPTQDLSALPPPNAADQRQDRPAPEDQKSGPVDPRIAFAQRMLGGQAPASGAVRPPQGPGEGRPQTGGRAAEHAAARSTDGPER
ncbi:hypothetical protein [Kribbella sp. NPDC023855]|uniref:hypothetical protein n=1 Tax=Kribbella sp. NPDC023855 TaxID=3154698 RepID=UPI0033F75343